MDDTDIETPTELVDRTIYAMPQWVRLPVTDPEQAAAWYVEAVGMEVLARLPGLVHLRRFRYQDILLVAADGPVTAGSGSVGFAAGFTVDLDDRAARARRLGTGTVAGPTRTPWNTVDLTFTDPDGHVLVLSRPVPFDQFDPAVAAQLRTRTDGP